MKFNSFIIVVFVSLFILLSFSFQPRTDDDLKQLVELMEGSFSSEFQSLADTNYYDIRLHIKRIWKERIDGYWLYVEQATAQKLDKPYRQRVYHVTRYGDSLFESAVFTFQNPIRFAGDWKKENPLAELTPDSLISRAGCSVFLKKISDYFYQGSTIGKDCPSELRGAKYATSEVSISRDGFVSWDRGFDENDKQVWGAEYGGYEFLRVKE